jgi:HlyD family secretion protein
VDGTRTDRQLARRRSPWPVGVAAALLVALAATIVLARARASPPAVPLAETELARVTREVLVERVSGPGQLVPRHVRWLTATHRARVEQVRVQPGDRVTADTLVAVLRNPEMDLALLEARRELSAARVQLGATDRSLAERAAALALSLSEARERASAATRLARQGEQLETAGVSSATARDDALSRERELAERLRLLEEQAAAAARQRAAELEPGHVLVAALEQIVAHRKRDLDELEMKSGAAGVVHSVSLEPGQWVESGFLLAKVIVSDELAAELSIDELEARDVSVGQAATILLGSVRLPGHVTRVDPMATRGVVSVEVGLNEACPGARADQRVSGEIEVRRHPEALSLRAPAQVTRAGHFALFKRRGDTLVAVDAELLPASGGRVLVKSGLLEGDEVAISDLTRFEEYAELALR